MFDNGGVNYIQTFEKNENLIKIMEEMPEGADKDQLLEHYIEELFQLPIFKELDSVRPAPLGCVKFISVKMSIDISQSPWDIRGRIYGPNRSTMKGIQKYSECDVEFDFDHPGRMNVRICVRDHENVAQWKIGKVKKFIEELMKGPDEGGEAILKLQMAELAVRRRNFENRLAPPIREIEQYRNHHDTGNALQHSDVESFRDTEGELNLNSEGFGESSNGD